MIHSLTVENFRAIRGTREYELPAGVIAFIGHNERGKTSSLLALAFAFYGSQAMPDGIDSADLINDHAAALRVAVRFDHKGDAYALERTQRRDGRGDATLTRNGAALASGRAPVTQAITELFGVDHVGFMVSVFARQDELDALAGKRGAERVTTMLRLLGVEQADAAVKAIRKDANEERRSLELLRAGVGDVALLNSQRVDAANALAAQRSEAATARYDEAAHVTKVGEIEAELVTLAPQREAFESWRTERGAAALALAAAQARLADAQAAAR